MADMISMDGDFDGILHIQKRKDGKYWVVIRYEDEDGGSSMSSIAISSDKLRQIGDWIEAQSD